MANKKENAFSSGSSTEFRRRTQPATLRHSMLGIRRPEADGRDNIAAQSLEFRHTKCCFESQKLRQVMSPRKVLSSMRQAKIDQVQRYEETIEALRRAEQKYRSIFENATEGIFQTTPEGKYLSANPALARMYGYDSPKELLADLTDISRQLYVEPDRRRKFTVAMRCDGRIQDFESQIYRRDGSVIWISENARAVHDEVTGELLYYEGMVQDITRRKAAEEARKQAEEKLVRYAQESPQILSFVTVAVAN